MLCINRIWIFAVTVIAIAPSALAQPGTVKAHQKISDTEGGFAGDLDNDDGLGINAAGIGDLNRDGTNDLVATAWHDDDGASAAGAVWILFLNSDGTVTSHQKISQTQGGFTGDLSANDNFGVEADALVDLDGDGVSELVVGAPNDDDGGTNRGAVWILFLNTDGTVKAHQKISQTQGGFTGALSNEDWFGMSTASLDDLDGDGVGDLAVGARNDDDGGPDRGAVWILFLNTDGTVKAHQKISQTQGGFTGTLVNAGIFGQALSSLGDLDGDGAVDLAVGNIRDNDGGTESGAVWILFLNTDGTVKAHQKISDTEGGFTGSLSAVDHFGYPAPLGDLDDDGVNDLAVGASRDDDGGTDRGAVWILFLNTDGTVKAHQKISDTQGGFTGQLDNSDGFARLGSLGDLDGDGVVDIAVGTPGDDDGGTDRGAVWILFLNGPDALIPATLLSFNVAGGTLVGGDLQSLEESDDDYVQIDAQLSNLGTAYVSRTLVRAKSPATTVSRLDLTLETGVDAELVTTRVFLRNFDTGDWDLLDGFTQSESDSQALILDVPNPNAYVRDDHGQIGVQIETRANAAQVPDGYVFRIDHVQLAVTTGEGGGIAGGGNNALPCDLDGDGVVGASDLVILLGSWGECGNCNTCQPDFNTDCVVDATDLLILLGNWG